MIVIVYSGFVRRGFGVSRHIFELQDSLHEMQRSSTILSLDAVPAVLRYLPHALQAALNTLAAPFGHYVRYRLGARLLRREFRKIASAREITAVIFEDIYNSFPVAAPSVCVLHALQTDNLQAFRIRSGVQRLAERYEARRIQSSNSPVVTVSEPYRRAVMDKLRGYWKAPPTIGVIPLGVRLPEPRAEATADDNNAGLRMVFVGPLEPRKNTLFLLDVAEKLLVLGKLRFTLTFIGDGPDRPKLESHAKARGLTGHVVLEGKMTHSEVLERLNNYHVLLHPSLKESFGYSLLEAKVAGLTVVASQGLEVPDDFVDVALPLDPGQWADTVVRIAADRACPAAPDRWRALSQLRQQYDSRRMTVALLEVLEPPARLAVVAERGPAK